MKTNIIIIFTALCLISCQKKNETLDTQSTIDSSVTDIENQRTQDSINQAKKDSIALVQEELKRETIEKYRIKADAAIPAFTKKYMNAVSFFSGKNPRHEIIDSETEYNPITGTVKIVFVSKWEALPSYDPNQVLETHESKGRITYYANGETQYEEIEINETLRNAIEDNDQAAKVAQVVSYFQNND